MKKIIFFIVIANLLGAIGALVFVNSDYVSFSRILMLISLILNIYWVILLVNYFFKKS